MRLVSILLRSRVMLAAADILMAHLGMLLAFYLRFGGALPEENYPSYQTLFPYMAAALVVLFLLYDLYSHEQRLWSDVASALLISVTLLSIVSISLSFYLRTFAMPRSVLLLGMPLQLALLGLWRYLVLVTLRRLTPRQRVVVVGRTQDEADGLFTRLDLDFRARPVSTLTEEGAIADRAQLLADLEKVIELHAAQGVYVAATVSPEARRLITELCLEKDIRVYLVPDLYEIVLSQARLSQVGDTPFFEIGRLEPSMANQIVKRMIDLVIATIGLVIAAPVMLLIGLIVALESPGPVIFRQTRVTQQGRPFMLYKFRTMVQDAERKTGPVFATANDPRLTRVGAFLRNTRLDELPQLVNILLGEMSLVGPRPERPIFVDAFAQKLTWYTHRLRVKPGLTGLAQISGRYSTSVEDKLRYDILYASSQSLMADIRILAKTVRTIMFKQNAS